MAYVPHVGHAVWARRFSLQRAQVTSVGAVVFHCERRLRVLERLLQLLERHRNIPVLLGPAWDAAFLNVRDARLVTADGVSPSMYTWDRGWVPAAA